jgi:alkylation response protein AidB-like acyl-CoA dehydrogenase
MSFSFGQEQQMLRDSAVRFAADAANSATVRESSASTKGYSPTVWKEMVDLGWTALAIPEKFGGLGLGQIEQSIVAAALGGPLMPSPLLAVTTATRALLLAGSDDQQQRWLPAIAGGETIATVALTGPNHDNKTAVELQGENGQYMLAGEAGFVVAGHVADLLIVAARTSEGGLKFVAIPATRPGITRERSDYIDLTRAVARIRFDAVKVEAEEILEIGGDTTLASMLAYAKATVAAEQAAMADRALAITVDYTKQRVQFGQPIGMFQAIKHALADVAVATEAADSAVWYAAATADQRWHEFHEAAAVAKLLACQAASRAAAEMIQFHGGIGFTWEHDAHLYFRRARAATNLFGGLDAQTDIICAAMIEELSHAA